jgi:hypothetical protein
MLSGTMRFSASSCPASVNSFTRVSPDLSVASVRVSETVITAIFSGLNSRSLGLLIVVSRNYQIRF